MTNDGSRIFNLKTDLLSNCDVCVPTGFAELQDKDCENLQLDRSKKSKADEMGRELAWIMKLLDDNKDRVI